MDKNANDVLGGLVDRMKRDNWFPKVVVHCPKCDATIGGEMRDDQLVAAVNALPLLLEVVKAARDRVSLCGVCDGKGYVADSVEHGVTHYDGCPECSDMGIALARLDEGVKNGNR